MAARLPPSSLLLFQNAEVGALVREAYDLGSLGDLLACLGRHQTLRVLRFSSGGACAVTPLDLGCLECALRTDLIKMWDRDSAFQALAERFAGTDDQLRTALGIDPEAAKKGLLASLRHHGTYGGRFLDIISDRTTGDDFAARPHIRYHPVTLEEIADPWGHAQNDALGLVNFLLFYLVNVGYLRWEDAALRPHGEAFACLLHHYFWKIHVWEDFELGVWEETCAEHASSILVVVASLLEQLHFMHTHGRILSFAANGHDFRVTETSVGDMLARCRAKLRELLPREFTRSRSHDTRDIDAALVNGLFLSALSGRGELDERMTVEIIDNVEQTLMAEIGICRYRGDAWDGLGKRQGGREAQWCHVSPMISAILGDLYRRTHDERYLSRQIFHFNRTLAAINERWHLPEAYIVDEATGQWMPDVNDCLAWAQAMAIIAFASLKASLAAEGA